MSLPTTEDGLYAWMLVLAVGYIGFCYIVRFCKCLHSPRVERPTGRFFASKMFDGATFGVSVLLLVGIFDHAVLTLLGSTKPFLVIAGLAGLGYTIHAMFES